MRETADTSAQNILSHMEPRNSASRITCPLRLVKRKLLIKGRTKFGHFQRKVGQNSDSQTRNHTLLQEHTHTSMLPLHCSDESQYTTLIRRITMRFIQCG